MDLEDAIRTRRSIRGLDGPPLTSEEVGALVKLAEFRQQGGELNFLSALIHAQLGDREAAFAALERAWQVRDSGLLDIKVNPYLDPLRSDPRYANLVERVGYPV